MRRASNAVLVPGKAKFHHDRKVDVRDIDSGRDLDAAVATVLHDAKERVDDLSHDLRQPLTSITMNVQSAIRCLQASEPRVASALEALSECLALESELLALVGAVQRHLSESLAESSWHPLDERGWETSQKLIAAESTAPARVGRSWPKAALRGSESATRTALVAIAGSILDLVRTHPAASPRDAESFRIDMRRVSGRAQLRVSGIRYQTTGDIEYLRQCAARVAAHLPGRISVELGPTSAAIVISLPTWTATRRPLSARGNHGA
jgi:hypothetical protein